VVAGAGPGALQRSRLADALSASPFHALLIIEAARRAGTPTSSSSCCNGVHPPWLHIHHVSTNQAPQDEIDG